MASCNRFSFLLLISLIQFLGFAIRASAGAWDPPPTYYNGATGTGSTLMQQLDNMMTAGHHLPTYGDARFLLDDTDEDPNNPSNVLLFYHRISVSEVWQPNSNNFGTREHVWPTSRRPDSAPSNSTRSMGSDLHMLKPLDQSTNSSRGNDAFGNVTTTGSNRHVGSYYFPGDADKGDAARIIFYGATRWKDEGLKIVNGVGNPANFEMGDLASLIGWHYLDPPDTFERRRNHLIYGYQGNRNAFIDRPEFVWSVYVDQMNDSRITIGGGTTDENGGSTRNVDLGRVFVDGTVPSAQSITLHKDGNDGTYFEVATTGAATSSTTGRYNAFRTNGVDSKSINVGLNTTTATAELRSGTVTIDNLDVTTGGGAGSGANDANDTINVSLAVLDHATPSFATDSVVTSLMHDFGSIATDETAPTFDFDVFNMTATPGFTASLDFDSFNASGDAELTTDLATSAGSLSLAAGMGHSFTAMMSTAGIGNYSATYMLTFSDEDLPGALSKSLTLTLAGEVFAASLPGDYNDDGVVNAADYVVWRDHLGGTFNLNGNGNEAGESQNIVDGADYELWRVSFGNSTSGAIGGATAVVPEPAARSQLIATIVAILLANCLRTLRNTERRFPIIQ